MKRYRVGLIHKFSDFDSERVDGLRSALGGFGIGRIPPHITLVAPANIHPRDVGAEIHRLRTIASETEPYELEVGPAGSFSPISPVLYLAVGGDLSELSRLQTKVISSRLYRAGQRPFVPHVTILEPAGDSEVFGALEVIKAPLFKHRASSFEMMVSSTQGYWEVSGEFRFEPARKVHRGGLSVEVFPHSGGDLALHDFVATEGVSQSLFYPHADRRLRFDGQRHVAVSLYHDGQLIACASSAFHSTIALIRAVVVRSDLQRLGIGSLAIGELLYQLQLCQVETVFAISSRADRGFFEKCGARPASGGSWLIGYENGMTLNSWSFSSL